MLACLRFADLVTKTVVRRATGRTLDPLDGIQSFMVASRPPIPFDPQGLVALEFLYVSDPDFRVVSLNCCDELHFWKQMFDCTQSVKELYGHPIRKQLTRRPDMICQTRCHRWGHRSPCTR